MLTWPWRPLTVFSRSASGGKLLGVLDCGLCITLAKSCTRELPYCVDWWVTGTAQETMTKLTLRAESGISTRKIATMREPVVLPHCECDSRASMERNRSSTKEYETENLHVYQYSCAPPFSFVFLIQTTPAFEEG